MVDVIAAISTLIAIQGRVSNTAGSVALTGAAAATAATSSDQETGPANLTGVDKAATATAAATIAIAHAGTAVLSNDDVQNIPGGQLKIPLHNGAHVAGCRQAHTISAACTSHFDPEYRSARHRPLLDPAAKRHISI
jgi:hypothetical protein